jgi:hypothetical protein
MDLAKTTTHPSSAQTPPQSAITPTGFIFGVVASTAGSQQQLLTTATNNNNGTSFVAPTAATGYYDQPGFHFGLSAAAETSHFQRRPLVVPAQPVNLFHSGSVLSGAAPSNPGYAALADHSFPSASATSAPASKAPAPAPAPGGFQFGAPTPAAVVSRSGYQVGASTNTSDVFSLGGLKFGRLEPSSSASASAAASPSSFHFGVSASLSEASTAVSGSASAGSHFGSSVYPSGSSTASMPASNGFQFGTAAWQLQSSPHQASYNPDGIFPRRGQSGFVQVDPPPAEWTDASAQSTASQARKVIDEAFPAPKMVSAEVDNNCFRAWELGHQLVNAAAEGNLVEVQQLVANGVPKDFSSSSWKNRVSTPQCDAYLCSYISVVVRVARRWLWPA